MPKILLVEDDVSIARSMREWLESESLNVDLAASIKHAEDYLKVFEYDLLILDWQLPDGSGVAFCRQLRDKIQCPIFLVTGKSSMENKLEGLESGADDYITKPFDSRELMARVKILLRRGSGMSQREIISIRNISINTKSRVAKNEDRELELTPKEFDVLEFFFKHPNQVISQDALLKRVWDSESDASHRAVYSCINRHRKNIDPSDKEALIKTVHGVGYRVEQ